MSGKYYTYRYAYPQGFIADNGTDLSGVIFYIGKGKIQMYLHRIDAHEVEARSDCACRKCNIIRSIWAKDMLVDKAKMLETDDENEALSHELQSIQVHASPHLTNYRHNPFNTTTTNPALRRRGQPFEDPTRWNNLLSDENKTVMQGDYWITLMYADHGNAYCVKLFLEGKPWSSREQIVVFTHEVDALLDKRDVSLYGWSIAPARIMPRRRYAYGARLY